jgi:hypothetical protein
MVRVKADGAQGGLTFLHILNSIKGAKQPVNRKPIIEFASSG